MTEMVPITVKLPAEDVRLIPSDNRSEFVREAVREKLERSASGKTWKPKTALGRKLKRLREKYVASGGELLDAEGIARELRERSGAR
jgi:Arc/MetJ-type ribon-helix-helix transcriptional regulator